MAINPEYQGKSSVAITELKDINNRLDYNLRLGFTSDELTEILNQDKIVHGLDFRIVSIYNSINFSTAAPLLLDALKKLRQGEKVDLEKLLE